MKKISFPFSLLGLLVFGSPSLAERSVSPIVVRRAPRVSDVVSRPVKITDIERSSPDAGFERLSRIESEYKNFPKTKSLKMRARGQKKTPESF